MDSSTTTTPKRKKGLSKLWAKVKASMRSKSSLNQTSQSQVAQSPPREQATSASAPIVEPISSPQIPEQTTVEDTARVMQEGSTLEPLNPTIDAIEVDEGDETPDM